MSGDLYIINFVVFSLFPRLHESTQRSVKREEEEAGSGDAASTTTAGKAQQQDESRDRHLISTLMQLACDVICRSVIAPDHFFR